MSSDADSLVGKRIKVKIFDPDKRALKETCPDIRLFEATVYGKVFRIGPGSGDRLFYLIRLDEEIEVPGIKPLIRYMTLTPPRVDPHIDDYIRKDIDDRGFASVTVVCINNDRILESVDSNLPDESTEGAFLYQATLYIEE